MFSEFETRETANTIEFLVLLGTYRKDQELVRTRGVCYQYLLAFAINLRQMQLEYMEHMRMVNWGFTCGIVLGIVKTFWWPDVKLLDSSLLCSWHMLKRFLSCVFNRLWRVVGYENMSEVWNKSQRIWKTCWVWSFPNQQCLIVNV